MQNTNVCGITYPELVDTPDIPSHLSGLALDVDTLVIPKFSSASARDSAITSPTDGQHCYLTSDHRLYVYRGPYSAWFPYIHSILKVKSANETLGNSTTLQDDNHITGITVKASTNYLIRGVIMVQSPAAADFKLALSWSVSPTEGSWAVKGTEASNLMGCRQGTVFATIAPPTQGAPAVEFLTIEGYFVTAASPGTVKLQWAKNSGDAGTTTVFAGSWLEIVEAN